MFATNVGALLQGDRRFPDGPGINASLHVGNHFDFRPMWSTKRLILGCPILTPHGTVLCAEKFIASGVKVHKQTQRVAIRLGDSSEVVAEMGLYNLTQQQAPLLVHFSKDRDVNSSPVRLPAPEDDATSNE